MTATFIFYFQDSQVVSVEPEADDVMILFSAAAVGPVDRGAEAPTGYLAPVRFRFLRATWQGYLPDCVGRLAGAELRFIDSTDGKVHRSLSLPCALHAAGENVSLRLDFSNGAVLHMTAYGMQCALDGGERYTESYAC